MKPKFLSVFLLLVFLFSIPGAAANAGRAHGAALPAGRTPSAITPRNVSTLVDGYVAKNMAASHTPGMVVIVVQQGRVVLARGYGYANLEAGIPMTPETNLRAGSVSKPVTSAAVLKLAAEGLIDLNAPASDYIHDLPLQDRYGQASTVAQLLTLKGGYADKLLGTHTPDVAGWQPLGEYLVHNLEPRVNPPGVIYSYTSWEHALLGYLLEQVRQQPFDQVMAEILFEPLGMRGTTFTQPLPESMVANLAQGYAYKDGEYQVVPLDLVNLTPGIAMVTTAQDMGRFMLALLDNGELDGQRVLPIEAVHGLLTRQEEVHPYSRARTYGFSEIDFGHRPALYHDGNGIGFGSRMVLVPEHQFGVFISVNHRPLGYDTNPTPAYNFMRQLSTALMEEFIPATFSQVLDLKSLPDAALRASNYTGQYALASTPQHDFFKIGALLDYVDVSANQDGTLNIGSGRYMEVEPLVFRRLGEASSFVVFRENAQGQVQYLTFGGTNSYKRIPWYESLNFSLGLVVALLIVFISFVLLWPFTRRGHWAAWLISLLNLVFLLGFGWMLLQADLILFFKTIPLSTRLLLALPWFSAGLALSLPVFLLRLWGQRSAWWHKLHYSLTALGSLVFVWFVWNWNLFLK